MSSADPIAGSPAADRSPVAESPLSGRPKLLLLGTPEFAVPAFEELYRTQSYDIRGVLTQPDKPAGRGNELTPSPVKEWALARSLPVLQPSSLKNLLVQYEPDVAGGKSRLRFSVTKEELLPLAELLNEPLDAAIAVAYGKIIPRSIIDAPRCGVLNIHPSLLPRWRGAAPVHHTVFAGDTETGVALMAIDEGLDTGPVYAVERVSLSSDVVQGELSAALAQIGAMMLVRHLPAILAGTLVPTPQAAEGATYADKWEREDCLIRWTEPAETTERRIRASAPDPGARTSVDDLQLKVYRTRVVPSLVPDAMPGEIVEVTRDRLAVQTGTPGTALALEEVQLPGKKRLPIADVLRGRRFAVGTMLS